MSLSGNTAYRLRLERARAESRGARRVRPGARLHRPAQQPAGDRLGRQGLRLRLRRLLVGQPELRPEERNPELRPPARRARRVPPGGKCHARALGVPLRTVGRCLLRPPNTRACSTESTQSAREADPAFEATSEDIIAVGHRFHRPWQPRLVDELPRSTTSRQASRAGSPKASVTTPASAPGGSTARCRAIPSWTPRTIRQEIGAGRYDLTNPLSMEPDHLRAIERSSLREELDFGARYLEARFALEGAGSGVRRARHGHGLRGVLLARR